MQICNCCLSFVIASPSTLLRVVSLSKQKPRAENQIASPSADMRGGRLAMTKRLLIQNQFSGFSDLEPVLRISVKNHDFTVILKKFFGPVSALVCGKTVFRFLRPVFNGFSHEYSLAFPYYFCFGWVHGE